MTIKFGDLPVSGVYAGSSPVSRIYQGSTLVYQNGPVFSPLSLNPALLIEAYDSTTRTPTGGPFSQIIDKSGHGFNYNQSTSGSRPTLGTVGVLPALRFDGVDDNMTGTYVMPYQGTVVVVCEPKANLASAIFFGGNTSGTPSNGRRILGVNALGNWSVGYGGFNNDTATLNSGIPATANVPVILIMDCKGPYVDLYVNGGIPVVNNILGGGGTPTSTTMIGRFLAGGSPSNIAIAAIFCTAEGVNLTATERNALGNYFANKVNNG